MSRDRKVLHFMFTRTRIYLSRVSYFYTLNRELTTYNAHITGISISLFFTSLSSTRILYPPETITEIKARAGLLLGKLREKNVAFGKAL